MRPYETLGGASLIAKTGMTLGQVQTVLERSPWELIFRG
jgi:hypothetical protein